MSTAGGLKAVRGDGRGGEGITMIPEDGNYDSTLVFLHGLGDDASGWAGAMDSFKLARTKFVLPSAEARPITLNGGMTMPGWTDIFSLTGDAEEDRAGFQQAAARINDIIDAEISAGIKPEKVALGGFSQGGGLAVHVTLRRATRLAACVVCSGWLPLRDDYPKELSEAAKSTPILQCHGTDDAVVGFHFGQLSHAALKDDLGLNARFEPFQGMGHSACEEEMAQVSTFLNAQLK